MQKTPLTKRGSFVLGAFMPFAELRAFSWKEAKLLASLVPSFTVSVRPSHLLLTD